ncbi:MAG: DUF6259 domain-containing protein [Monoglobales bacterium]
MKCSFDLNNKNRAEFEILNNTLTLSVNVNGQNHTLTFLDEIRPQRYFYDASAYTEEKVVPTFSDGSEVKILDNMLEITTHITNRLTAVNTFIMCKDQASILLETYFITVGKVYDCSGCFGKIRVNCDGFDKVGGGDIPEFFELKMTDPNYGFSGYMIFKGEEKYLKVSGGSCVNMFRDIIDPHMFSMSFNEDLSFFGESNPLRTAYTFEETDLPLPFPEKKKGKKIPAENEIKSGDLTVGYNIKNDGAVFVFDGTLRPINSLLLKNVNTGEDFYCDTASDWENVSVSETGNKTVFTFKNPYNIKDFMLILSAEKIISKNRIEWSVEVINNTNEYTLMWCGYPRMYYSSVEKCDLFRPCHGGAVIKNVNSCDTFNSGAYPSGFNYPMPYYAIYPNTSKTDGRYYAVHDENGALKDFYVVCDSFGQIRMSCRFTCENYTKAGNSQKLPGKAIFQKLDGDWYDAAGIYKEFVSGCDWYPKAGENGRDNIPTWMKDIPFWIMDWMPNESKYEEPIPVNLRPNDPDYNENSWFETPIKLRKELGVPIGFHLYNWHGIPFNNDYPHFLPAKKALPKGLEKLKNADIRIMPYTNALLWDNKDKIDQDFRFTKDAFVGAVKNEHGRQHILKYASHEPDGELCQLSPMCPSAKVWRDELKDLISRMFNEYDFDAIYLDQIAARIPHLCMDENHGHPLGGGSWWQKNYRELLKEINTVKPEGKAFTTEANAEVYADDIDGFLSWAWIAVTNYVPAFMHIYGGKTVVLGRNANGYMKDNLNYWKYHIAQGLVAGEQLGWINSDFVYVEEKLKFAKNIVGFRYENKEFFRGAFPLRPPIVKAEEKDKFCSGIGMGWQGVLHQPYLCTGILASGNKRKMIVVNIANREVTNDITFRADEALLTKDNHIVCGEGRAEFISDDTIKFALPENGVIALDWEV